MAFNHLYLFHPLYLTILQAGLRASIHNGAGVLSSPQASIRQPNDRACPIDWGQVATILRLLLSERRPERRIPTRVFWGLNRRLYEE